MNIRRKGTTRTPPARILPRPSGPPRRGLPSANDPSRVGVRELRQNLSVYLDRVKAGESLTVTEHGHIIATLGPASKTMTPIERLIAEGRAAPATRSLRDLAPPRSTQPGTPTGAQALIAERERVR